MRLALSFPLLMAMTACMPAPPEAPPEPPPLPANDPGGDAVLAADGCYYTIGADGEFAAVTENGAAVCE